MYKDYISLESIFYTESTWLQWLGDWNIFYEALNSGFHIYNQLAETHNYCAELATDAWVIPSNAVFYSMTQRAYSGSGLWFSLMVISYLSSQLTSSIIQCSNSDTLSGTGLSGLGSGTRWFLTINSGVQIFYGTLQLFLGIATFASSEPDGTGYGAFVTGISRISYSLFALEKFSKAL